jgi:hypothetical protein
MALDSLQPGNAALIKVATQGSVEQQPAAATGLRRAALYATGRVYFPRRHYAIALRVGTDGARETQCRRFGAPVFLPGYMGTTFI